MAARLIQMYYDEKQKAFCYPFAKLHFNEGLTIFFENYWIKELVLASTDEKLAVCSWKLRAKMKYYIGRPRELTQEVLETDYEVLAMTKNTKDHYMLRAADRWHPGFLVIFDKILTKIGVSRPNEIKIPIYQNSFAARVEIYKDYVIKYLSPAMDYMLTDKEINALAMQDSRYSDLTHQSGEMLKEKLGINYYPLAPFLLERLFSVYCQNNRINITHL